MRWSLRRIIRGVLAQLVWGLLLSLAVIGLPRLGQAQISIEGAMRGPYVFAQAARDGNYWFVRNSLTSGVSPNLRDSDQRPAIVLAAMNGHSQVVDLLIQSNAQVNLTDPARNTFTGRDGRATASTSISITDRKTSTSSRPECFASLPPAGRSRP